MPAPLKGITDCRVTSTTVGSLDVYVSLLRLLTGSAGQSLGIQRIAYNRGTGGTGENYTHESNPVGPNAWSCFAFTSASKPFYMFVQCASSTTYFGAAAIGQPVAVDSWGQNQIGGLAASFAIREDGLSPWNGTTNNNGSDTKGSAVWTAGTSSLMVFPRANSTGGSYATNKQNLSAIITQWAGNDVPFGSRFHCIVDENNIAMIYDANTGNQRILFFGKYTPRSGSSPTAPYVMLRNHETVTSDPIPFSTFGTTAGSTGYEGSFAHPTAFASGTRTYFPTGLNEFFSTLYQPHDLNNEAVKFDEFPIYIVSNEAGNYGYVGYIDFMRIVYNVPSNAVSQDGTRAFFGPTTLNQKKLSLPWSSSAGIPGTRFSIEGTLF